LFCLWLYRRSLISLAGVLAPSDAPARSLALSLLAVSVVGIFCALPGGEASSEFEFPLWLQWLRPYDRHYRLLLLSPMWGAWAMIIAPKFCRLSPAAGGAASAFANGCEPFFATIVMILPLAGTLLYFQYLYWWWLVIIPASTILTATVAGLLCSRGRGLRRAALLAANLLTQLVFLLTYLAGLNLGRR
jgi:hypothetical protein